jgi:prevent-host-death family protein
MDIDIEQDIVSVTSLKRQTKDVMDHVHASNRPVIVTVNGRADVVLMSASTYERLKRRTYSTNVLELAPLGTTSTFLSVETNPAHPMHTFRKFKVFWQEFKYAYKVDT